MSKRKFQHKNILITGAAGNLGTALCECFGRAGAQIIALDLSESALLTLRDSLEKQEIKVFTQACDITDKNALKAAIAAAQQAVGAIDVLINNAGITHIQHLVDIENKEQVLRKVMEVNLFAAAACCELVLDDLIKNKGLIINISSVAGFAPLVGRTAYAASKHALQGYFESLRNELHPFQVQCLTVCPSFIGADAARMAASANDENSIYQKKKVLGKTIDPYDVAKQILVAAEQNRPRLIVGQAARLSYFMRRFFPNLYEKLMRKKLTSNNK